jgi:hypothetical protein
MEQDIFVNLGASLCNLVYSYSIRQLADYTKTPRSYTEGYKGI